MRALLDTGLVTTLGNLSSWVNFQDLRLLVGV